MLKKISFVVCLFSIVFGQAQKLSEKEVSYFRMYEDSLNFLAKKIYSEKVDSIKFKLNKRFVDMWDDILSNDLSFHYPFDSIKDVSRLTSPDAKFRIITWDIEHKNGSYFYFGFLQAMHPKTKHYELYPLTDKSAGVANPETYVGDNTKWFGMLYNKIIPCEDYYTLIAWDGNDNIVTRKFIDILSFKPDGTPVFGKDVFTKIPQKFPKRVMFQYSAELVMSCKYHEKGTRIVFDHLAPKDPMLEGQFQFYGPDFSYDAFVYKKGKWQYTPDIDIKNEKNDLDDVKRDKKNKEKPMYVPH